MIPYRSMDIVKRRGSTVCTAAGYGLDSEIGVRVPVGSKIFASPYRPNQLRPTQPPIQWVLGTLSQGVNRPGRESDHSLLQLYQSVAQILYEALQDCQGGSCR
jgi:hypothetical protein